MKKYIRAAVVLILLIAAAGLGVAQAKAGTLKVVGLYSETSDGYISYRVGTGAWVVVKVGDTIPANGEIKVNVDRDWVEVIPATNPNAVYEIDGPDTTGTNVIKRVADILKSKARVVSFPKGTAAAPDPKFKNKLVVTQYLGRQVYLASADADDKDIKYGDILDIKGKATIIAINNTINLMNASGQVTTVIGPLKYDIEKVLTNQKLYKFLNVPR